MDRNVRKKIDNEGEEKQVSTWEFKWTMLPNDTVLRLFSSLNNRDRASLSSTCKAWWILSKSPCLWRRLDLRFSKCDATATKSLASRCIELHKIRFSGDETAASIINLKANDLREIRIDHCKGITDATLSVLVARHEALECLQTGLHDLRNISSVAVKFIALCCPNLKKLWLCGLKEVSGEAINALAENCQNLVDIGLVNCKKVDVVALGNVKTLAFLSVAGSVDINWNLALLHWSNLNLVCLDVSRTDIQPGVTSELLLSCFSLKVLCALDCPSLEHNSTSINRRGKRLVAFFTYILKELSTLFIDEKENVFLDCRKSNYLMDRKVEGVLDWLERNICNSMLLVLKNRTLGHDDFWLHQGTVLLFSFLQSPHEDVQERAATALQPFIGIDVKRGEAVVREGGIHLILNHARAWQEGLQLESVKAISYLLREDNMVKLVLDEGGLDILINIVKSASKTLATETLRGLWNISISKKNKSAIAKAGGVRALVDVIAKWSNSDGNGFIMEMAVGSLANVALDEQCCMEVISMGVASQLVKLLRTGMGGRGMQKQAVRCLAIMAHGDSNKNHAAVGQEIGAVEALVQLVRSHNDNVREEAVIALSYLSFKEIFREAIAAADGVYALVALASSWANASHNLHVAAARTLWGLSLSEENSAAIGQVGGVTSLLMLARSIVKDIHETAAGALWNLAYNAENAMRIINEDGVPALIHLCFSSVSVKSRFMSVLALANIFDAGLDDLALTGTSRENTFKHARLQSVRRLASKAIKAFLKQYSDSQDFLAAASSSLPNSEALACVTESARVQGMSLLECRALHIGRFVTMLYHPSPILKSCAAFALLQFTIPGDEHMIHHANLLQLAGAPRVLRVTVASVSAPPEAKAFARIVLKNLEYHNVDHSN